MRLLLIAQENKRKETLSAYGVAAILTRIYQIELPFLLFFCQERRGLNVVNLHSLFVLLYSIRAKIAELREKKSENPELKFRS